MNNVIFLLLGSIAIADRYYSGATMTSIIDLNCTGSEDNIWNCPSNALLGQYTCSSNYYHAGIACHSKDCFSQGNEYFSIYFLIASSVNYTNCTTGQTRLSSSSEGRVELCYNNVWYGICGDSYYYISPVICGSLGLQQGFK